MLKNKPLIAYKIFFALLGFSAIVTEIAVISERGMFDFVNFFSYFTVQVNILVALTFILSAVVLASRKSYRWLDVLRTATTMYILVVGIGFAVLLSGLEDVVLTAAPWDNTVLHYIIPLAAVIDFIVDRPRTKLRFVSSLPWLLYPTIYAAYSLIRGSVTGWYPYPFLDLSKSGVGSVVGTITSLIVLGVLLTVIVTWATRHKKLFS